MTRILLVAPVFPAEMPLFTRAALDAGAEVIGLAEGSRESLPDDVASRLTDFWSVGSLWDEDDVVREAVRRAEGASIDRVECLWEPGVLLAARIREALGVPGMNVEQTTPFRDKGRMKTILDAAGVRTPKHDRARTEAAVREHAERIGYPVIIKPIAGAGSLDTHRVDRAEDLPAVLERLRHVEEVSVEEFIVGEEYTYDTICANGEVLFENVSWYRPVVLVARTEEWISPQTVALRDLTSGPANKGREMGRKVLSALGFREGFTHMEWFLTPSGEAVFGEIACRPPGARSVDIMAQATDGDPYRAWAEAILRGELSSPMTPKYNAVVVFKRARGQGRITRIEGLEAVREKYGPHLVGVDLLPLGAQRRNWKHTLLSDGWITLRHEDLHTATEIADTIAREVQIFAG
ncbi:MAG: ATP-grasp domain-containing protein [Candidatus Eisenbacteria bacterium]